jgi:phage/plasmid primase-like uncharacterized protein
MIAPQLIERALSVRIENEVAERGIKLKGRIDRCGSCPVCGGTDRFSIHTRKQVFNCRGCGIAGDVIKLVQHLDNCTFVSAVETLIGDVRSQASPPATKKIHDNYEGDQHRKAAWLWSQRKPIIGSIAELYLRSRGITCVLPATLGFLPARGEYSPAMIAAFGLVAEPEPGRIIPLRNVEAVHLTKLKPDGGKAYIREPKIIVGSPGNLPIVIAPANDLFAIGVFEGIEDALTVHETTGLGAWVAGSAGRMPKLAHVIPNYVECLTIYAHADQAGQHGAYELAQALDRRGIEVLIEGLP